MNDTNIHICVFVFFLPNFTCLYVTRVFIDVWGIFLMIFYCYLHIFYPTHCIGLIASFIIFLALIIELTLLFFFFHLYVFELIGWEHLESGISLWETKVNILGLL